MKRREDVRQISAVTDAEVVAHIEAMFEQNYHLLRLEGGHALAGGAYRRALQQALLYWRRLRELALEVTETEVKLSLPGQRSPKGRPFVVEGVVDIVRRGEEVELHDIKTRSADEVRAEIDLYREQLNVYAYIWTELYRERLDRAAIVATGLPEDVAQAIRSGDDQLVAEAIEGWDPVVELPLEPEDVRETLHEFGCCVDSIEDGEFDPPSPERLAEPLTGLRRRKRRNGEDTAPTFAHVHCRNCDARFSCDAYRTYLERHGRRRWWTTARTVEMTEEELDQWIEENLGEDVPET